MSETFPTPAAALEPLPEIPVTQNGKLVRVYSKPDDCVPPCMACRNVKRWLNAREIPFLELDITTEANLELAASYGVREAPMIIIQPAGAQSGEAEIVFGGLRTDVLENEFEGINAPVPTAAKEQAA